jgi:hypothetical protein
MKAKSRKNIADARSSSWTLYNPEKLTIELNEVYENNVDVHTVDQLLLENGFNKAMRIRESVIRSKCELITEVADLDIEIRSLENKLRSLRRERGTKHRMLVMLRNILRISRHDKGDRL